MHIQFRQKDTKILSALLHCTVADSLFDSFAHTYTCWNSLHTRTTAHKNRDTSSADEGYSTFWNLCIILPPTNGRCSTPNGSLALRSSQVHHRPVVANPSWLADEVWIIAVCNCWSEWIVSDGTLCVTVCCILSASGQRQGTETSVWAE